MVTLVGEGVSVVVIAVQSLEILELRGRGRGSLQLPRKKELLVRTCDIMIVLMHAWVGRGGGARDQQGEVY